MDKNALLDIIEMPEGARETLRRFDARVNADRGIAEKLEDARRVFYADGNVKPLLSEIASDAGLHEFEAALGFLFSCADEAKALMRKQGHPEKVFCDSMRDLAIWSKVCYGYCGVWGIREFDWLARTLRARLWRLGRLQFEYETFNYDDFSAAGYTVKRGERVLNVHIPADGPFPAAARLDSYRQARDYFGMETFMCDSYLLYPPFERYLDPASNVVSFMHEYHVVRSCPAGGSTHNLRYLFGDKDSYDIASLPRDTAMRRGMLRMLEETGDLGVGVGVMFFDGERIR